MGCATAFNLLGLSCMDASGQCAGRCLLDAECDEILKTIATQDFSTSVAQCLVGCTQAPNGGATTGGGGGMNSTCLGCAQSACITQVGACALQQGDPCNQFLTCAQACQGDNQCLKACADNNKSSYTDAIVDCTCMNCNAECGVACP